MGSQNEGTRPQVLIVDLGSQYTLKIESTLRELKYRSAMFELKRAEEWLKANPVKAIILSGGPKSVNDADAPVISDAFYNAGVPVLCICYGTQDAAKRFGGTVESIEDQRGYSVENIETLPAVALFKGLPSFQKVWASHGDSVTNAPPGFRTIARNVKTNGIAAMVGGENDTIWCVQFHPEVSHTPRGKVMLSNFVSDICGCEMDWKPSNMIKTMQSRLLTSVGTRHAIVGFSGGVDSTTLTRIASVLGNRLHAVLLDADQLDENELEEIQRHAQAAGVELTIIDIKELAHQRLSHIIDPKVFRVEFSKLYVEILLKFGAEIAERFTGGDLSQIVLLQGTTAPDRIESGVTSDDSEEIKKHHNVGNDTGVVEQIEPFCNLFKYEIRALARKLMLPKSVSERHPSPGPGNYLMLPGIPKTAENLAIVRWVKARVRGILEKHNLYHRISQLVPGYGFCKTVGIKGDGRVYEYMAAVRVVRTSDFMTVEGVILPPKVVREIETVLTCHPRICRVLFDSTNKPPATTVWE